jgi:TPR repeat protein
LSPPRPGVVDAPGAVERDAVRLRREVFAEAISGGVRERRDLARLQAGEPGLAREAASSLERLAAAGDAESAFLLGLMYYRGQGVERDIGRARELHAAAARDGILPAALEYSLLLRAGEGGPVDLAEADRWEQLAADGGEPRACLNRGARAASGELPDLVACAGWYARAAAEGNADAAARLAKMHAGGAIPGSSSEDVHRWVGTAGV